ncbi:hypothetical protein [Vibrio hyugaensis]|uniref:hypothetical protein n=1 Tax=Vibrio hyugaensis TaxID=1534743 RepID=UPI003D9FCF34
MPNRINSLFNTNVGNTQSSSGTKSRVAFGVRSVRNVCLNSRKNEKQVPQRIHHFWQGDISNLKKHYENLEKVANKNPSYKTQLHLIPTRAEDLKLAQSKLPHVEVKDLTKEKWFSQFKQTDRFKQFQASKNGERSHLASGADIIKTELLARKGGVWNDVDNPPLKPLPKKLTVSKGNMLTAGPVVFKRWGGEKGFHSSTLATHRKNKILKEINKSSYEKFQGVEGVIYQKNSQTENPDNHFKMISETAGSLHLSRELIKKNPTMKEEVESLLEEGKKFGEGNVVMDEFFEPTVSTGAGKLDKEQAEQLVVLLSDSDHVVI